MQFDKWGYFRPSISEKTCLNCGKCLETCHMGGLAGTESINDIRKNREFEPDCYAAWAPEKIRRNSSSGGVLSVLAQYILKQGDVVFGAAWNEQFNCDIIEVRNESDLEKIRYSKYVQSNTKDTYNRVGELLTKGITILYTAVPCQIAGLYTYLAEMNISTDALITVEVMCNHMPSVKHFVEHINQPFGIENIKNVNFRPQNESGWYPKFLQISMKDGEEIYIKKEEDLFYRAFAESLSSRHVCNSCRYKDFPRISDITVGDFWRVGQIDSSWDDDRGTSAILVNSKKGMTVIESIMKEFDRVEKISLERFLKCRNQIGKDAYRTDTATQKRFFELIQRMPYDDAIRNVIDFRDRGEKMNNQVMIINFCHRDFPINYGQTLLALALSETVKSMGFKPVNATYTKRSPETRDWYYTRYFFPDLKTPESKAFSRTTAFLKRNMDIVQCFNEEDVYELEKICDILITGGDVVWSEWHFDPVFYLNFGAEYKRRISYAASIGTWKEEKKSVYQKIFTMVSNHIDYISTREEITVSKMEEMVGCERAVCVCDPVFLLSADDWKKFEKKVDITKNYVLVYVFGNTEGYQKACEAVLKIYKDCIPVIIPTYEFPKVGEVLENGVDISEFLWLFRNAAAVITNSFHGTAFSILYNKQFYLMKREDDFLQGDQRLPFLLDKCGIGDRAVDGDELPTERINYDMVNRKMNLWIEYSRMFLQNSLNGELE